jgi:hypothetical protein
VIDGWLPLNLSMFCRGLVFLRRENARNGGSRLWIFLPPYAAERCGSRVSPKALINSERCWWWWWCCCCGAVVAHSTRLHGKLERRKWQAVVDNNNYSTYLQHYCGS